MVTASGATWGFRRTIPHMFGIAIGLPVMLLALALGVGEVLQAAPWLHRAMRWAGAAYMLWLAWKIATADPDPAGAAGSAASRPLTFLQAALFQWVNPKAWVVALGALAAYTTATGLALMGQTALLGAIFLVVTLPLVAGWTLVGVGAARLLRTRRALRLFNLAMAALLVASLLPMLRQ
jgi:threonine/homoserine/homoserine lactone efflux protein